MRDRFSSFSQLKAELAAAVLPAASVEDLLGLAAHAGLHSPGQVMGFLFLRYSALRKTADAGSLNRVFSIP